MKPLFLSLALIFTGCALPAHRLDIPSGMCVVKLWSGGVCVKTWYAAPRTVEVWGVDGLTFKESYSGKVVYVQGDGALTVEAQ